VVGYQSITAAPDIATDTVKDVKGSLVNCINHLEMSRAIITMMGNLKPYPLEPFPTQRQPNRITGTLAPKILDDFLSTLITRKRYFTPDRHFYPPNSCKFS
jgi:hypothetical protein